MHERSIPFPARQTLRKLGRDIAVARRKRRISTIEMASRLMVSRDTIGRLERGDPDISIGTLATAAFLLQIDHQLSSLFGPLLGSLIEESRMPKKIHSRRAE